MKRSRSARADGLPRGKPAHADRPKRPATPARTALYRCATCGAMFVPWAPAERHADTHGGARIEWLGL